MGLDQYKVEVLHYINPHLIWVLVRNESDENAFHFEQIGVYAILPQNLSFGEDCVLKTEPCEQWMPAAAVAMNRCFLDAAEVWFAPTCIDKKSSFFYNNAHKYGDLLVVKKNGEKVDVLQAIVKSDFGYEDESFFYEELRSNNLKTDLNFVTQQEVFKRIEGAYKTRGIPKDIWMNTFKSQTTPPEAKLFESAILARKLEVCDDDDVDTLRGMNVLKLCKDIDEVSLGRACSPRKSSLDWSPRHSSIPSRTSVVSMALRKKLEWLESQSIVKQSKQSSKSEANHSENRLPNIHTAKGKTNEIHSIKMKLNDGIAEEELNNNTMLNKKNKDRFNGDDNNTTNIKGKHPRPPVDKNTPLVGYGPAGLQINQFITKRETTNKEKAEPVVQETRKPEPELEYQVKKSEDVYAYTDSEVQVPRQITSKSLLLRLSREVCVHKI